MRPSQLSVMVGTAVLASVWMHPFMVLGLMLARPRRRA